MASKDDTALWLHNKLGSQTQLWSSSIVVTQYTLDKLQSIKECFQNLDSIVKMKFFLSLFHIPKRNLEEFKLIVKDIIEDTIETCTDQWVLSIATFMQSYWETQSLDTEATYEIDSFKDAFNDLKKSLKKGENLRILPLECDFLSKAAKSTYPELPQPVKHFNLIRLAKSAAVIQDLKTKATNYNKNKKSLSGNISRNMSKLYSPSVVSGSGLTSNVDSVTPHGFIKRSFATSSTLTGKPSLTKPNIGIKLLEIQDQPISSKEAKRKKKEQEKETKKKIKLDPVKLKNTTNTLKNINKSSDKLNDSTELKDDEQDDENLDNNNLINDNNNNNNTENTNLTENKDEINNNSPLSLAQPSHIQITPIQQAPSYAIGLINNNDEKQQHNHSISPSTSITNLNLITSSLNNYNDIYSNLNKLPSFNNNNISHETENLAKFSVINLPPKQTEQHLSQPSFSTLAQQPSQINDTSSNENNLLSPNTDANRRIQQQSLSLTREQMLQAQEMFFNSNRLTRPEKALILGFMAGSRDNPRPEHGPLITIKLNETEEILSSSTGQQHKVLSEIFFQMNYDTGEYKKIKKIKPIVISASKN